MNPHAPLPQRCKAGVVSNNGPNYHLAVKDVAVPKPGPDQLLIKLNATGLCYSDIHYMLEDLPLPRMGEYGVHSPGHEGAGVVVAVGHDVKGWKPGDRAGIAPTWDTCMSCELCSSDMECHCPGAVPTGLKVSGTYQQYIVSPARYTTRIPNGVDDFSAGPIMCSGSTMFRALRESKLHAGQWVVIIGAGGGVGHMGVQIAKAMGLRVIGVDTGEDKEQLCFRLGCEGFVDHCKSNDLVREVIQVADGQGAHGVLVTASSAAAYRVAPQLLRVGGVVVCVGMPASGNAFAGEDPMYIILKNLKIVGSLTGSRQDTLGALSLAARGLLKPVYEMFSIEQLPDAVGRLRQGKVKGRCVVNFNT
ncbi:chaperonin 10-like protein [Aspergillus pseudocaelatus]|uniref:Chaperonin 10-like protein n=1 Tax=Aspergillus pseudocaelatus TaxID=1825620 RepID=A0ABQ6WRT3_9EURO|nr:chaperonin 10-like protein [Aspergillus pseudocaelatus]